MDQYLVASIAVLLFSIFALGAYITNEERKSRREPNEMGEWPL